MTQIGNEAVREALTELADERYQRREWIAPNPASFIECVSGLWDDSGLSDALDRNQLVYSPAIDAHLTSLKALLDRIDGFRQPIEIIEDPLLGQARSQAAAILRQLQPGQ